MASKAIGPNDVVSVMGNYLVKQDGTRFFMKGIGFPVSALEAYNATAWIGILQQLNSLELEYNTVRVYNMEPTIDYSEFFNEAASLGIYVIVPLTAIDGDGVLDRTKVAPKCYPRKLFKYGVSCLHNYLQYPNVLAGLLANEVVDTIKSWKAAPCVKAYGRDLKLYLANKFDRPLPLIYAAQHSGIGASYSADEVMQITMDYFTCDEPAIDIFGVNIESWCSSQGTFEQDEKGEVGSYYSLWQNLHQSTLPLVFTEMGCSHDYFNKDNGLQDSEGTRNWKQVPIVLNEMADTWSGFCAYAYSGNPMFDMFTGGPWRNAPLKPTKDFYNFRTELHKTLITEEANSTSYYAYNEQQQQQLLTTSLTSTKTCSNVQQNLRSCCDIDLYSFSKIAPYQYVSKVQSINAHAHAHLPLIVVGLVCLFFVWKVNYCRNKKVKYQPIG